MIKFEFSYDINSDNLFLFKKGAKSKGSVELGNLILDFDYKKNLVGLQLIDATRLISDLCDQKNVRELLEKLRECRVETKDAGGVLVIWLILISEKKQCRIPINVPSIKYKSPALTYP